MADRRKRRKTAPRKILKIPTEYFDVVQLGNVLFPALYQFENGLRLATHHHLTVCYGPDWWKLSLQTKLPDIFKYEETQRTRMAVMPWIGASARVAVLPVHLITLGHLEQIITKYQSDCIPELFPLFYRPHASDQARSQPLRTHVSVHHAGRHDARAAGDPDVRGAPEQQAPKPAADALGEE